MLSHSAKAETNLRMGHAERRTTAGDQAMSDDPQRPHVVKETAARAPRAVPSGVMAPCSALRPRTRARGGALRGFVPAGFVAVRAMRHGEKRRPSSAPPAANLRPGGVTTAPKARRRQLCK